MEAKCPLQMKCEMSLKIDMFNVKDKRNLAMEGEVFFQDVEVESSKVDEKLYLESM